VSFIGELFLEKFLVIGVVRIITTSLITRFLTEYDEYHKAAEKPFIKSYEDTLEGLLKFYEIIGKAVEEKESKEGKGKEKDKSLKASNILANFQKALRAINAGVPSESVPKLGEDDKASLEDLFKIFQTALEEGDLTSRLDSLVKNLMYRRANKWVESISKNQGPKTMKELHEEFLREQLEAERRADEYREELRDSYYQPKQKNTGYTNTPMYFQVANEGKPKQQEETKVDVGQIDVDTNIRFRPNRGGKQAADNKGQSEKPKFSVEQLERDIKDIYKLASGEEVPDKTSAEEEIKKLVGKAGGREVLHMFFRTFHDGRLDAVPKRFFIPNLLIETQSITEDDFIEIFQKALNKMFDVFCDSPNLDNHCAVIFLEYCKKAQSGESLKKFYFSDEFYKREDVEFILEFYQEVYKAILANLEREYADLKDVLNDELLKDFAKKIKFEK